MKTLLEIVITMVVIALVIGVGISIMGDVSGLPEMTYACCCNGSTCTDTYYDNEDELCHLLLCERGEWLGFSNCTYEAKCPTTSLS